SVLPCTVLCAHLFPGLHPAWRRCSPAVRHCRHVRRGFLRVHGQPRRHRAAVRRNAVRRDQRGGHHAWYYSTVRGRCDHAE
ncbi:hypothetical protein ElyMa_004654600, partial [Elysia marginata]